MSVASAPLSPQQIAARLAGLDANTLAALAHALSAQTPPGIAAALAPTIQSLRIAEGWCKPPGVKLAEYNFSA